MVIIKPLETIGNNCHYLVVINRIGAHEGHVKIVEALLERENLHQHHHHQPHHHHHHLINDVDFFFKFSKVSFHYFMTAAISCIAMMTRTIQTLTMSDLGSIISAD